MANRLACFLGLLISAAVMVAGQAPAPQSASERDVLALESRVHAGDQSAMHALFAMETDGAVSELVDVIIGGAIRNHPRAFLEVATSEPEAQCSGCLDSLLGNLGDDFVDMYREQVEELTKRRDALRSVDVPSLRTLRDKCVAILNVQISMIQSLLRQGLAVQP
jgi:hypothetical protein